MITITVEHETDTAHRLSCHTGKCRNLHGHRYKFAISIEGSEGIEDPLFLDFYDLKRDIRSSLDYAFDHATVLCANDENHTLIELLMQEKQRVTLMKVEPTVEAMVQMTYELLQDIASKSGQLWGLRIRQIVIYETPTNYCTKVFE